jgi:hypothetical protein
VTGTFLNIFTVLVGGSLGLVFGQRFSEKIRQTVLAVIGLFTMAIGIQMFLKTENPIAVLLSLVFGAILGEAIKIEATLERFGGWLQAKFSPKAEDASQRAAFVKAFLTASLVFCVGPMTILGSIQDGLTGDFNLLAIKSVLDGFAAMAFAATLGPGVLFSVIIILLYQGGISLLAAQIQNLVTPLMITEMTAAGGIILVGLALSNLLEIKPIRAGNLLPGLVIAPLLILLFQLFSIN